jgi:hypothetical protein
MGEHLVRKNNIKYFPEKIVIWAKKNFTLGQLFTRSVPLIPVQKDMFVLYIERSLGRTFSMCRFSEIFTHLSYFAEP